MSNIYFNRQGYVSLWMTQTGFSVSDLAMRDVAYLTKINSPTSIKLDIFKCKDPEYVIDWCRNAWGEPCASQWIIIKYSAFPPTDLPHLILKLFNEAHLIHWKLAWD